jgi:hypothetical protein
VENKSNLNFTVAFSTFCLAQFTVITAVLALSLFALIFSYTTGHGGLLGFLPLLDVGNEQSIPTYVSTINLLLASIFLFVIYSYEKTHDQQNHRYWLSLAALFLLLSIDESASIHEQFANVHDYLAAHELITPMLNTHQWLPFGLAFIALASVIYFPFVRKLPRKTMVMFFLAATVFIAGAVGLEYLGALMLETGVVESRNDIAYLIRRLFEEGFEMYGIVLFNCTLYREILQRNFSLTFG